MMRPRANSSESASGKEGRGNARRRRRMVLAGAPVAFLCAAAAACSSSGSNAPAAGSSGKSGKPSGTLTLSVQVFGAPILDPVLKAFEKAYPAVQVEESVAPAGAPPPPTRPRC